VDLYATCWQRIVGGPVKERALILLAEGEAVTW
jgi:hypothetical protein